jgi:hypothetical protein
VTEGPLIPGALFPAQVCRIGWPDRKEAGVEQHSLGGDIAIGRGGSEGADPVSRRGERADVAHGRSRDAAPGDMLCNAVPQLRDSSFDEHQVEPAKDRSVLGEEHVIGAVAGLLVGQEGVVPLGELLEVRVAPVGDRSREVGAVGRSKARIAGA